MTKQPDLLAQESGVVEAIKLCNIKHKSNQICKFLPKFHPELNPIKRVWSRMKWYVRQMVDDTMSTLPLLMFQGLSYPDDNKLKNLSITK